MKKLNKLFLSIALCALAAPSFADQTVFNLTVTSVSGQPSCVKKKAPDGKGIIVDNFTVYSGNSLESCNTPAFPAGGGCIGLGSGSMPSSVLAELIGTEKHCVRIDYQKDGRTISTGNIALKWDPNSKTYTAIDRSSITVDLP